MMIVERNVMEKRVNKMLIENRSLQTNKKFDVPYWTGTSIIKERVIKKRTISHPL